MKTTPDNITELKENQVFVFGSNASGFHGAGAAGLACRGESKNSWRGDVWFLRAMKSPKSSPERIGKWAVYGVARGYSEGREGKSYAIQTIHRPGEKRSTPLSEIRDQIKDLISFAQNHPTLEFLVTKIGSSLAGYSPQEIKSCFEDLDIPDNIWLPKEYQ